MNRTDAQGSASDAPRSGAFRKDQPAESRDEQSIAFTDLNIGQVSRLLEMGIRGGRRPVDKLVERLAMPDGGRWWTGVLAGVHMTPLGDRGVGVGLDAMRAMKDTCKVAALTGTDPETRHAATAGYYGAIAAALAHHGVLITSQPAIEVDSALSDIAGVVPEPWSDVFGRGVLALERLTRR
jgi:hypothetical protein